jgi:hypothetical protein
VFTEDADFVDILGRHHQGRSTIAAGHRHIIRVVSFRSGRGYDSTNAVMPCGR